MSNTRPRNFGDQIAVSVQQTARGVAQGAGTAVELARLAQSGRGGGQTTSARTTAPPTETVVLASVDPRDYSPVEVNSFDVTLEPGHLWLVEVESFWDIEVPLPVAVEGIIIPATSRLTISDLTVGASPPVSVGGMDYGYYVGGPGATVAIVGGNGGIDHHMTSTVKGSYSVGWNISAVSPTVHTATIRTKAQWLRPLFDGETL